MTATARSTYEEALALEQSGDIDKALVSYLKAQELSPQDTEIAYRTASALLKSGHLDEAQSQLRRIVFAEPDNLKARASLGNCQLLLNEVDLAVQNFQDVLAQDPDNRNALYGLISIYLNQDRVQEAAGLVKRLVTLLPEVAAVQALLAEVQSKTGQTTAAIAAYRKALKLDPSNLALYLGLAGVLLQRKRYQDVVELMLRAHALAPSDPKPLEFLADALAGSGALEDALESLDAALKLEPKSAERLVKRSVLCRKLGRQTEALAAALTAHDLAPETPEPLNALGAALAALKHMVQARSVLTGLSKGEGLAPDVRAFTAALLASEPQAAQEPGQDNPSLSVDASPALGGTESEAQHVPDETQKPLTSEPSPEVYTEPKEPVAVLEDDVLPNVLGLQRRDRSRS